MKTAEVAARKRTRRPGRPTKLTAKLVRDVGQFVQDGNYKHQAALACGISRPTFDAWVAKGEELDGLDHEELTEEQRLFVDFSYVVKVSEALSEVELVALARVGAPGWQAYMTLLERRFPARWKRRDEIEVVESDAERTLVPGTPEYEAEMRAFGMPAALAVALGPEAVVPPVQR